MTMNLQYISDNTGQTTGVFIPIAAWTELLKKYKGILEEQIEIPAWQQEEVRTRLADHASDPAQAEDFEAAMDEIEKAL